MVKKIKYFLIVILVAVFVVLAAVLFFNNNFIYSTQSFVDINDVKHVVENDYHETSEIASMLLLKHKIYSGLPFEKELIENIHLISKEDVEFLRIFSFKGIKNMLQIKRDFINVKNIFFNGENIIKDFMLKNTIRVDYLNNREIINKIVMHMFLEEYKDAINVANMANFINYTSLDLFNKWKKDLENYVAIDDLMKKYL